MLHRFALLYASLAGCTSLTGRVTTDGGADAAAPVTSDVVDRDVVAPDASTSDRPAVTPDVPAGSTDAPMCPLGEMPALDARLSVTIQDTGPGSTFAGQASVFALGDASDRVYTVGLCRGCAPGSALNAAVWRFNADGRLDATFGQGGVAVERESPSNTWFGAAVDTEGRVWTVGYRAPIAPALARFGRDGGPDDAFNAAWRRVSLRALGAGNRLLYSVVTDAGGALVVGGNGSPSNDASTMAFAVRVTNSGALDASFAEGGVMLRTDLHGCYDVARDGEQWVLGCISIDDRPALLRLDAMGRVVPWGNGEAIAMHPTAPRGFQLRAIRRDSAGRWIAAGAIARVYNDLASPPAAVRFGADGAPDTGYGVNGLATVLGARQSFAYSFAAGAYVGCEDRLLLTMAFGTLTGVAVFDRDGHLMTAVGDEGVVLASNPGAGLALAIALVPSASGAAVTLLSTFGQPAYSMLHRVRL